jgi:hypothetical protein
VPADTPNPSPPLPVTLRVTTQQFNLLELVERQWGASFREPDHRVYVFGAGKRNFDSTDMGFTGIYGPQGPPPVPAGPGDPVTSDSSITSDSSVTSDA